jgi:DNA-binding CsgD family transcriptional regulator
LVIWSTTDGVIAMANQRAADLASVPLKDLIGRTVYDFALIPHEARAETEALASGGGGFFGARPLQDASHRALAAHMWSRAVQIGDQVAAVALVIPAWQMGQLDPDPSRQLRRLYPVAVGAMSRDWSVIAVSVDIVNLTGLELSEIVAHSLHDIVHPDDVGRLMGEHGEPPQVPMSRCSIRMAHRQHGWVDTCWLLSPFDTERWVFAVLSQTPASAPPEERIASLEFRLRRIGAEVEAAGILEKLTAVPPSADVQKLQDLTTRQWEVVTLLLHGKRVPTIARELFISQSTVRNHLSAIFKKFGVHSQPELLESLRK